MTSSNKYLQLFITLILIAVAPSLSAAGTIYKYRSTAYSSLEEAESAMRAFHGSAGQYLELLDVDSNGDILTRSYSIRMYSIQTEPFSWQSYPDVPAAGIEACQFTGPIVTEANQNDCNTSEEYLVRQETLNAFRFCETPPPDSHLVPELFNHIVGGGSAHEPEVRQFFADQLGISISRVWGVIKKVGLYQSYSFNQPECADRFELEPTQNCAPNTTCSPGPSLTQNLLGICPIGLTEGNRTHFAPSVFFHFPRRCTRFIRDSITVEPMPGSTDSPIAQSNDPCVGNPCNVVSGDKFLLEDILDIAGLSFELSYHSIATTPTYSRLGKGWRHNFDSLILDNGSTGWDKTLITPSGKVAAFDEDPAVDDTFFPLLGSNAILRAVSNTEIHYLPGDDRKLIYTNRDGGDRHFLSSITNLSDGRVIHINRNANWIITSISTHAGRRLDFEYDGETGNRLLSIQLEGQPLATFSYTAFTPAEARLDSVQFADGATRSYAYTDPRFPFHVTGITDENGNQLATYTYQADGKASSSESAGGAGRITLDYQPNRTVVDMPLGSERTYELSRAAPSGLTRLDRVIEDGLVTEYLFDGQRPTIASAEIDPNGNRTDFEFDALNRATRVVRGVATPETTITETDWNDTHNRPSQIRFLDGSQTVVKQIDFTYNADGQVFTRTESDPSVAGSGRTTTFAYHQAPDILAGLLFTVDGPRNDVVDTTTFAYRDTDAPTGEYRAGDLHTITNAAGHQTEFLAFDATGRPLQVRDPNGILTTFAYDPRGRLISSIAGGEAFGYDYDDAGNLTGFTPPDGSAITFVYDGAHRLTGISDALGNAMTFTLDAAGNRTAEENADSDGIVRRSLGRVYDQLGRLRQLLDHRGVATRFTYDDNGNPISVTDPIGRFSSFAFDALDRLTEITDTLGPQSTRQTELAYDTRGNLLSLTDPLRHATTYEYNGLDQLERLESPDRGASDHQLDPAGNLVQRTDARGEVATFTYDEIDRLTAIQYASDSTFNSTFTYDDGPHGVGQLTGMTDGVSGSTAWSHDQHGRVIRKTQTTPGGVSLTVRYGYIDGRLATITYPSGRVVSYSRDAAGRIDGLTFGSLGKLAPPVPIIDGVDYLPFGPVARIDYARSIHQDRLYDQDYDPSGFSGGFERGYTTNDSGEITAISLPDGSRFEYAYDALGRLTSVESPPGKVLKTWSYDVNGNLTSQNGQPYGVDADSNRILTAFQTWFQYDEIGSLETVTRNRLGTFQLEYGPHQRLVHFSDGYGEQADSYTYNPLGERVAKTTTTFAFGGGNIVVPRLFVYDESGRLLGEYDEDGSPLLEYHWLGDLVVSLNRGGTLYQVYTDHLGAPREVRDGTNTVVWRWDSTVEPYGNSLPDTDPDRDEVDFTLNLRFPGQYHDFESGYFYNRFRDYDPETGRYIQSDPIGLAGGLNTYAYANNNPSSFIDPLGLLGFGQPFGFDPETGPSLPIQEPMIEIPCRLLGTCPGTVINSDANCARSRQFVLNSLAGAAGGAATGGLAGAAAGFAFAAAEDLQSGTQLTPREPPTLGSVGAEVATNAAGSALGTRLAGGNASQVRKAALGGGAKGLIGVFVEEAAFDLFDRILPDCPCLDL